MAEIVSKRVLKLELARGEQYFKDEYIELSMWYGLTYYNNLIGQLYNRCDDSRITTKILGNALLQAYSYGYTQFVLEFDSDNSRYLVPLTVSLIDDNNYTLFFNINGSNFKYVKTESGNATYCVDMLPIKINTMIFTFTPGNPITINDDMKTYLTQIARNPGLVNNIKFIERLKNDTYNIARTYMMNIVWESTSKFTMFSSKCVSNNVSDIVLSYFVNSNSINIEKN